MTDNNSHTATNSSFPPSDWVETALGEVCEITSSKRIFANEYQTSGIPFFRGKEVTEKFNGNNISTELFITEEKYNEIKNNFGVPEENDILLTSVGTLGNPYLVEKDLKFYFKDGNLTWFRRYKNINPKFLFYWIISPQGKESLSHSQIGSTQQAYTIVSLKKSEILLPPLPEQQAIASVLSAFDDKIELLREQNKTLEEMGQVIFQEWFGKYGVDDDKVNAEGREGGLGQLPDGWRVGKLGEENFAEIIGSGINEFDGEKTYLATADVSDSNITNTNEKITFQERPSRANMQPIEKSIWFAKMQDSRKLLMFDDYSGFEIENFILSTGFAGIKTTEFSHYFMWCFILSKEFDELKNNMANGAVQIAVNNTNLEKIEILIPDDQTLAKFNKLTKPIFKKIYDNNSQIQSLARSRDELLPRLMSGMLRVNDFSNN